MIIEVTGWDAIFGDIQWLPLDWSLVDLIERQEAYGNLVLQISTTTNPERIRELLPQATQKGVLEVRFSERPDYCHCVD